MAGPKYLAEHSRPTNERPRTQELEHDLCLYLNAVLRAKHTLLVQAQAKQHAEMCKDGHVSERFVAICVNSL